MQRPPSDDPNRRSDRPDPQPLARDGEASNVEEAGREDGDGCAAEQRARDLRRQIAAGGYRPNPARIARRILEAGDLLAAEADDADPSAQARDDIRLVDEADGPALDESGA